MVCINRKTVAKEYLEKSKMKFFIVVSALLVVALADDPHGIKAVHEKCQNDPETHVEQSVFDDLKKNRDKAVLPANFDKHVHCMSKGLNLITGEGKANVDGVKTHVRHVVTEADKVDQITKECAVDKPTEKETSGHIWKCLHKNGVFGGHHGHHHGHGSDESGSSEEHHHGHHDEKHDQGH